MGNSAISPPPKDFRIERCCKTFQRKEDNNPPASLKEALDYLESIDSSDNTIYTFAQVESLTSKFPALIQASDPHY